MLLLTFALLLLTGVFPQYVLITTSAMVALGVLLGAYWWLTGRKSGERKDERSALCSLMACRNAFMATTLLAAFMAVIAQMGAALDLLDMLRTIWALGMAAYFLSYLAYKRIA